MLATLIRIDGYDPIAGTNVTHHASSVDDSAVCHLNNQTWLPRIGQLPVLRYDRFDGAFGGGIGVPPSTFTMATSVDGFSNLPRHSLADGRIQIWTGEVGAPWASYTQRFDGRLTAQPQIENGIAAFTFGVDDRWLDAPLLATYAGTGGVEGAAALKGTIKPLALGAPRYVSGVLVDAINSVFQISGYGAIEAVEMALEGLARFGAPVGDYPTYAALVAAAIPKGRWATCLATGLVRFGAPPAGKISFLVKGDKAGLNGWARKPGQLIRRIALLAGGAGKIDDASLDALDAARPYNLSPYIGEQTTARQLIQTIAASVNAVAGVSWLGKLFADAIGIGSPSAEYRADGTALPAVAGVEQLAREAPWRKLALQAERTESVHALNEVAFTAPLVDLGDYVAGTTYREGNIVQQGGGSWIYINPTPTAGNAPPVAPATSNAWWKSFAVAGGDGATGPSGVDARVLTVTSNRQTISFNGAGVLNPATQTTEFVAQKVNTAVRPAWSLRDMDGNLISSATRLAGSATHWNYLLWSQQFDNALWASSSSPAATVTANTSIAPDGTATADTISDADAGGSSRLSQAITIATGAATWEFSIFVGKQAGQPIFSVQLNLNAGGTNVKNVALNMNVATGAVGVRFSLGTFAYDVLDCGAYWRLSCRITNDASADNARVYIYPAAHATSLTAIDGTATGTQVIWGAQLTTVTMANPNVAYVETESAEIQARLSDIATMTAANFNLARGGSKGVEVTARIVDKVVMRDAISVVASIDGADAPPVLSIAVTSLNLAAEYGGAIKTGQLPRTVQATMRNGAADVSSTTSWSVSPSSSITATISASGLITITAAAGSGWVDVIGTYAGIATKQRLSIAVQKDATPPQAATSLSTSFEYALNNASFPGSPGNVLTLAASGAGTLRGVLSLGYDVPIPGSGVRTWAGQAKLVYRTAGGGAWSDFSAGAVNGSAATAWGGVTSEAESGYLNLDHTQSGLTAGASYEVGWMLRRESGSYTSGAVYTIGALTVRQP